MGEIMVVLYAIQIIVIGVQKERPSKLTAILGWVCALLLAIKTIM